MPWLLIANAGGFAVATLGYDALTRVARAGVVDLVLLVALAHRRRVPRRRCSRTARRRSCSSSRSPRRRRSPASRCGIACARRSPAAMRGAILPRAGAAVTAGGAIAGLGAGALIPRLGLAAIPYLGAGVTVIVVASASRRSARSSPVARPADGTGRRRRQPRCGSHRVQRQLVARDDRGRRARGRSSRR